ncbi:Fe2OG dioxygenase domain-containing protein [Favolaschia claudopus]|uniref:Fe2OG dioxygenase domain-containing protein n=1 Tax=Favolaschia claudopus TaxID=2862362 RepID=A0AAW0D1M4_9AGAR
MSNSPDRGEETPPPMAIADRLEILRNAIKKTAPYTAGVRPVKPEDLVIYYNVNVEDNIDNASDEALKDLAAACQKATFGLNQNDVLDETYRKAGKMDLNQFATRLDVVSSALVAVISPGIMQAYARHDDKTLIAELYKLNVYGPGSFFKAHQDTPRSNSMIGSLVVVFPTSHKGGELTLEHDGTVWAFDSATEIAEAANSSSVAYVAFYSDVIHTVQPVMSGYRVTLTYNLFLREDSAIGLDGGTLLSYHSQHPDVIFENTLEALLADAEFLPNGGLLGFGLSHQYPIPSDERYNRLEPLLDMLKGSDARIRAVAQRLNLETNLKILYDSLGDKASDEGVGIGQDVLTDDVLYLDDWAEDQNNDSLQYEIEHRGTLLERDDERFEETYGRRGWTREEDEEAFRRSPRPRTAIHWVTKINELNWALTRYVGQGNEAYMGFVYGNVALFVDVPAFGDGVRAFETDSDEEEDKEEAGEIGEPAETKVGDGDPE